MTSTSQIQTLLDALDEPTLIVSGGRVTASNAAAAAVLGAVVHGSDVRLAIRHPAALERISTGTRADIEITGIGAPDRSWMLSVRPLDREAVMVRLVDRSAPRAAERMRVDFVANASHELRTPLATILGYAETIAEDGDLDPRTHAEFGGIIRSEAKRMLRIVEDLMSLSRIEADRFVAPRDDVSPGDVAKLAQANARELAEQRGCRVELDLAPDLPPVKGDPAQLLQMTDNLVTNAIKYGCGKRGCTVRIGIRQEDGEIVLSVADDGEGIAPEHLPRLTERFYRVDDARSRETGGTGLGLAIVKHIVERHRGTLAIRSAPGRGTDVTIRFPSAWTRRLS